MIDRYRLIGFVLVADIFVLCLVGAWALQKTTIEPRLPFIAALAALYGVGGVWSVLHFLWRPTRRSAVVGTLVLAGIPVAFFAAELTLRASIASMPPKIGDKFTRESPFDERSEIVEFSVESPYVKFRPSTCINKSTPETGDFVAAWCTDELGFKNPPGALARRPIIVVTSGDGFTEGAGVPSERTWTARLSEKGFGAYSVGVQGYSPEMSLGAVRRYGAGLGAKLMLFGCVGCTSGNEVYRDPVTGRHMGNMVNTLRGELQRREGQRYLLASTALAHGACQIGLQDSRFSSACPALFEQRASLSAVGAVVDSVRDKIAGNSGIAPSATHGIGRTIAFPTETPAVVVRYTDEINGNAAVRTSLAQIVASESWASVRATFLEKKALARERGADFGIVYFPPRGVIYYEAFAAPFPRDAHIWLSRQVIQEFCASNGIAFVDTTDALLRYLREIGPNAPPERYPYFVHDGHLNAVGHSLVATRVAEFLGEEYGGT